MPIFPGKLFLQGDNSGSFPIVESQHSRGTTFVIDDLTSASLAKLGSGTIGTLGLRAQGSIVAITGSSTQVSRYYIYNQTSSNASDVNISGSSWTDLDNWKEIVVQPTLGTVGTTDVLFNNITASGDISASGLIIASKFKSAGGSGEIINFNDNLSIIGNITASGNISSSGNISATGDLDIDGNVDIDGTLEADAITINGTTLADTISGTTVDDATNSAHVLITDNEDTDEENQITFVEDAQGGTSNRGLEADGDLTYNPLHGRLSTTVVSVTNITASGNISASGELFATDLTLNGSGINIVNDSGFEILGTGTQTMNIGSQRDLVFLAGSGRTDAGDVILFGSAGVNSQMTLKNGNVGIGTTSPGEKLEVVGNISASGEVAGATLDINGDGNFEGNITLGADKYIGRAANNSILFNDANGILIKDSANIEVRMDSDGSGGSAAKFIVGTNSQGTNTLDGTELMIVSASGNVGIGTTNPLTQLHIQGSSLSNFDQDNFADFIIEAGDARQQIVSNDGGNNGSALILTNVDTSDGTHRNWSIGTATSAQNNILHIGFNTSTSDVSTYTDADVVIDTSGNVGIGTLSPTKKLQVTGDISASGDILNTQFVQMTNSSSIINQFTSGSHQTCKYLLQVTSGSNIQSSEILVIQTSPSNAFNTEYAQINSGLNLVNFSSKVTGTNVQLIGSSSFISCSIKFNRTLI